MTRTATATQTQSPPKDEDGPSLDAAILGALPDPLLVADREGRVAYANMAGEAFFGISLAQMRQHGLGHILPYDNPLFSALSLALDHGHSVRKHDVPFSLLRSGTRIVNLRLAPLGDRSNLALVQIEERDIPIKIESQLNHRGAVRSLTGMASVLAHEIKNPLSGIRGAAQLLALGRPENKDLTDLICAETDRIVALIDSMESFAADRPLEPQPLNVHETLEHVRKLAQAGFASHVRFIERYDPSLPPIDGVRDRLIQALLNLVKNAAEAAPAKGGEIILSTAYRHGMRIAGPDGRDRVHLPLEIAVQDNGPGVSEDMRPHLFDPFVTSKPSGTGLGLSLVAKIVADHGGIVECENLDRGAVFRLRLPLSSNGQGS